MKRKITGIVFIIIGLSIIFTAGYLYLSSQSKQDKLVKNFEKSLQDMNKEENKNGQTGDSGASTMPADADGTIGIIIIPKINVKVAVNEGSDLDTLKYAAGHFKGTAMPGEKGNCCIAGHRNSAYNKYFEDLDKLAKGDKIVLRAKKGEFTYKITDIKVVEPDDTSVLQSTDKPTVTLVTCTPKGVFNKRLIIIGQLTS